MALNQTPEWRCKIKAGVIMDRLQKHANSEIEMTDSQIKAANLFLKKVIPDLSSVTLGSDPDRPVAMKCSWDE
jgi:hypothetical protein